MLRRSIFLAALAALLAFAPTVHAQPDIDVKTRAGMLDCLVQGSTGFIIVSNKKLSCLYTPANNEPVTQYVGTIRSFGLDIGKTEDVVMSWAVVATGTGNVAGLLAGHYAGVSASASAGQGGGANILIGGLDRSIALQPFSILGQSGYNLAIGVSQLELTAR